MRIDNRYRKMELAWRWMVVLSVSVIGWATVSKVWSAGIVRQDRHSQSRPQSPPGKIQSSTDQSITEGEGLEQGRMIVSGQSGQTCKSSTIAAPTSGDTLFVADCPIDGDLDTTCQTGQLRISLKVPRVMTRDQISRLRAYGLISDKARLTMPAFDVDSTKSGSCGCQSSPEPEFDLVKFNNREVRNGNGTPYLEGDCGAWRLNSFDIPLDWINFADDPGFNQTAIPAENIITIDVDVKNQEKCWCTSIDWASLEIFTPVRPLVMVHGVNSSGETWNGFPDINSPGAINFIDSFSQRGLPVDAITLDNSPIIRNLNSFEENAITIGNAVRANQNRWGVDKVNLLCHSKGGLDSREYVEFNDGVDKLIQLGTPNGGSPLADMIQVGIIGLTLKFGAQAGRIISRIAGPAGRQLTTPYMAYYNRTHGYNPDVSYYSIAGDYLPLCSIYRLRECSNEQYQYGLLMGITGRGDTIVPTYSVLAFDPAIKKVYSTRAENFEATHTEMTRSQIAFNQIWQYLIGPSTPPREMDGNNDLMKLARTVEEEMIEVSGQQSPTESLTRGATLVGLLRSGETQVQSLPISEAKPTTILMLYDNGTPALTMISPSGRRFDTETTINNNEVRREVGEIFGGKYVAFSFAAPEVGQWRIEVKAPAMGIETGYFVSTLVEGTSNELIGETIRPFVKLGEPLELRATPKQNGVAVRGAAVVGRIGLPDNTVREVPMRDDGGGGDPVAGDGTYTGRFTDTSRSGVYQVTYSATGGGGGSLPIFSSEANSLATVSKSRSALIGYYDDYGEDTDGDNLYNYLTIELGVNITDQAVYRLAGVLVDSRGNKVEASVRQELTAGTNLFKLRFDGRAIFRNGVDGPYALKELTLSEEQPGGVLPVDSRGETYPTDRYQASLFQHLPIRLTGKGSAIGVDTNGNQKFDLLRVGLEINITRAGMYNWFARLTDPTGREVGYATKTGDLRSGLNTLLLDFDGKRIASIRANGPYSLRGLIVYGNDSSLALEDVYATGPFNVSQFEGYQPDNPVPSLTRMTPESANAGSQQIVLAIEGTNFVPNSQVLWNGAQRQIIFESATRLWATIPTSDLINEGKPTVVVSNPAPAGGLSNPLVFTIGPRAAPQVEQEPNEVPSQATPLTIPGKMRGRAAVGDAYVLFANYENGEIDPFEDFFFFQTTRSISAEIKLTADNRSADLDLFLIKEENGQFLSVDSSINAPGMTEKIVTPSLAPGRYLVAVSARRSSSPYTVVINQTDSQLLHLAFDNRLVGTEGEEPAFPLRAIYTNGLSSPALLLSSSNYLAYRSRNDLNPLEGSLELRVKPVWSGNDSRSHSILSQGGAGGILIGKDSNNNLRLILNRQGARGGAEVETRVNIAQWKPNEWRHLVFTWSNSQKVIRIYVDGQLLASQPFTQTLPSISDDLLQIGGDGRGSYLEAVIDELSIFSRPLTGPEVAARFANP